MGLGDGLIPSDPEIWKVRRKLIEPFFSTKKMKDHAENMYQEMESFGQRLHDEVGKPIDLVHQIHTSTLNIILKSATSIPLDDSMEDKKKFTKLVDKIEPNLCRRGTNPFYYFDWLFKFFEFGRAYNKTNDMIAEFINHILAQRMEIFENALNEPENQDFIHLLEDKIDEQGIHNELLTLIIAGHESTAVALRWILFNLGNISFFIITLISMVLQEDIMVKDKRLRKGSVVGIVVEATHHDPKVYPNPKKYDPDRWSPENASKIPKAAYIPFGYGPRSCIGYRYAMIELKIYTIQIIRKFSLRSTRPHGSISLKAELL
ncbi:cytochrome P450 4F6-like [Tetranychus urticae]|uniref:cytochrome P450 4F6-like n=1 Tax=Tetranychus urticae TaxID=32264 RepID=UPI000D64EE5C|nr:cytochrome P450 4F6-like [Tetranychus urticae]